MLFPNFHSGFFFSFLSSLFHKKIDLLPCDLKIISPNWFSTRPFYFTLFILLPGSLKSMHHQTHRVGLSDMLLWKSSPSRDYENTPPGFLCRSMTSAFQLNPLPTWTSSSRGDRGARPLCASVTSLAPHPVPQTTSHWKRTRCPLKSVLYLMSCHSLLGFSCTGSNKCRELCTQHHK